jgi:hypothetical protein
LKNGESAIAPRRRHVRDVVLVGNGSEEREELLGKILVVRNGVELVEEQDDLVLLLLQREQCTPRPFVVGRQALRPGAAERRFDTVEQRLEERRQPDVALLLEVEVDERVGTGIIEVMTANLRMVQVAEERRLANSPIAYDRH